MSTTSGEKPVVFRKHPPFKNAELQISSSVYQASELAALMHVLTSQQKPWRIHIQ